MYATCFGPLSDHHHACKYKNYIKENNEIKSMGPLVYSNCFLTVSNIDYRNIKYEV